MLSNKQIQELKEHLDRAQNPLFFFDNDLDGLCSFLLLRRYNNRGKGVAIKSFPELNITYARKIQELNPDYIFVLDKPKISPAFLDEIKNLAIPFVWLDHHNVEHPEVQGYFNPVFSEKSSSEPTTYWAYKITGRKEDLWIALLGCIGDGFLPEFAEEFEKQYPELWGNVKTAFQGLYNSELGKIGKILSFGLKDTTTNVVRMLKLLCEIKSPIEILEENKKTHTIHQRFKQINNKYQGLVEKAKSMASGKLLYFQYGGDLSLSADIANELYYSFPEKIIVVAYISGAKANVSLRGTNVKELTVKAIQGIEGATGGGHQDATGCQMSVEFLPKFKNNIEKLLKN
jgi:single-stranded DNA-specific DHH superfamily exonuclease